VLLEDPAPDVLQQRLHLCPAGHLDRIHRVLTRRPTAATTPTQRGLRATIRQIIVDFDWQRALRGSRPGRRLRHAHARKASRRAGRRAEANCQIQVLHSAFYRNKGAYIIGKAINGHQEYPFAIAGAAHAGRQAVARHDPARPVAISVLFSLSRAYFMVDMEVPSGYVQFLRSIMPNKPRSELYTMLGLGKQGKTMFFRDLISTCATPTTSSSSTGHPRPGHAGVHAAVLSLRLQDHQGRLRQLEGNGPGHRQAQVPAGEAGGPRRAHGRHAGVLHVALPRKRFSARTAEALQAPWRPR
jgi:isocitrate dehydrogenase kinase/phosphatase